MNEQKNISFKKTLRFALTVFLFATFMAVLLAASFRQVGMPVSKIQVHLNEENVNGFLQKKNIQNELLQNKDIKMAMASIGKLDLKKMEQIAEANPWVANAEIYVDNRDILQMDITQREPVARIFCANGSSFYIDSTLKEMPVEPGYTLPAPVFTNVTFLRRDSMSQVLKHKIATLSMVIRADSFWNAQIEQIEVQPDQTFVLIPLLGNQRIVLGDTSRLKEKLDNLLAFYKQVPGKVGWNAYQTLDLRFKDQIVAAPSLETPVPKNIFMEAIESPEVNNQKADNNKVDNAHTEIVKKAATSRPVVQKTSIPESPGRGSRIIKPQKEKAINQRPIAPDQHETRKELKPKYIYPGR